MGQSPRPKPANLLQESIKPYPHAILFDFEAFGKKNCRKEPTGALVLESAHMPISVSVGNTLDPEPTHNCERDPKKLCRKFVEELERRGKAIRAVVQAEFMPADVEFIAKKQGPKIEDWCNQVPVPGFNSGQYDPNLIKEHFVKQITGDKDTVRVAKNANKIMYMSSKNFRFLDIINYLGSGNKVRQVGKSLRL